MLEEGKSDRDILIVRTPLKLVLLLFVAPSVAS